MNVVLYLNCAGLIIKTMFERHSYTKDKFIIHYIVNYENLDKSMDSSHIKLLEECDAFIYQPFNNSYTESEYDISNIMKYLKPDCSILKINYYRFKGFWYESEYKPYNIYRSYRFSEMLPYGLHNSFIDFDGTKQEIIDKVNNIHIDKEKILNYFKEELDKFLKIDDNSDVKIYGYFIKNYKTKHLFHDMFHPTNLFFYEVFRQTVFKLSGYELDIEDMYFIIQLKDIELTDWSLPILPVIRKTLELDFPDSICVFYPPRNGDKKLYMNVYDYYYIRLSPTNFKTYLDEI